ncbi:Brp/Blh family beta-carotene 15,15'-dioxygenase [Lewinella sp. IMCC34183]|uniref:Brp/Blh family beta-carotene 15,15'-dioxygenase n=1 Tax=Lewinella sp. IMCC34183 TaxID=2248762 RepID=UPI0013006B47|nr:Brp/Blh family beta-carotene 15,15'-dioxygenase [Lewinella sp. IMCC34183]
MRPLPWIIRGLTLTVLLLAPSGGGAVVALILVALGIPHGAADHLIYRSQHAGTGTSWSLRFSAYYLLLIAAYALLWLLVPLLALILFLAVSVYHFGQSRAGDPVEQLLWGLFVLGFPVLGHFAQAQPVIAGMIGFSPDLPGWVTAYLPSLFVLSVGAVAIRCDDYERLLDLALLAAVFLSVDLLLGFAIYFLLWHSLPAARDQWLYLRQHSLSGRLSTYLLQLLPLTLGAFVTLALVYWFVLRQADGTALPLSHLFILVSLITLPHALLVSVVYRTPPGEEATTPPAHRP